MLALYGRIPITRDVRGEAMKERHRECGGVTLIELMIVVAILGVLAAISVPSYLTWKTRSNQAEAKANLGAIYSIEFAFFGEKNRFAGFSDLGFRVQGGSQRYTYRTQATDAVGTPGAIETIGPPGGISPENTVVGAASMTSSIPGFTATATGNIDTDPTIDQWHVNDSKMGLTSADVNDPTS